MKNSSALDFFAKAVEKGSVSPLTKYNSKQELVLFDAALILKYADTTTEMCDLASGDGSIINQLTNSVKRIVAVEPFKEYSDKIVRGLNVAVFNETIQSFDSKDSFDLVTFFGGAQYFGANEIAEIYKKCFHLLKPQGVLIVKNQFGVQEDVVVSGYSEELKADYFSEYRHLPKEQEILASVGFVDFEVVDIYPPEHNRWENTHFYAIVCKRASSTQLSAVDDARVPSLLEQKHFNSVKSNHG